MKNFDDLLEKRVVLTTNGNVSFAGIYREKYTNIKGVEGCFIETDSLLGVCIWCPIDSVKELIEVPINEVED